VRNRKRRATYAGQLIEINEWGMAELVGADAPRKRSKFHNIPTTVDGYTFASALEASRYSELRLLERAGEITSLELQPVYVLQEAFTDSRGRKYRAINYRADFRYTDTATGGTAVEDVKGIATKEFRIKHKLLMKRYPDLDFRILTNPKRTRR